MLPQVPHSGLSGPFLVFLETEEELLSPLGIFTLVRKLCFAFLSVKGKEGESGSSEVRDSERKSAKKKGVSPSSFVPRLTRLCQIESSPP